MSHGLRRGDSRAWLALAITSITACLVMLCGCARSEQKTPPLDRVPAAKRSAVERCVTARKEAAAGASNAVKLAGACADVYSRPGCANAFRRLADVHPAERATSISRACRDAYCPELAEPKPRLCQLSDLPAPSVHAALWAELDQRILSRELGMSLEETRQLFAAPPALRVPPGVDAIATAVPLPSAGPDASTSTVLDVVVGFDEQARPYISVAGGPHAPVSDAESEISASVVALERSQIPRRSVRAVIHADKKTPYRDVVAVVRALRVAGIFKIAFATGTTTTPL